MLGEAEPFCIHCEQHLWRLRADSAQNLWDSRMDAEQILWKWRVDRGRSVLVVACRGWVDSGVGAVAIGTRDIELCEKNACRGVSLCLAWTQFA